MKLRTFPLNIRKPFYTVRVTKDWHTLPRGYGVSLLRIIKIFKSLEIFKACLDIGWGKWLLVAQFERGIRPDKSQSPLKPQ